MIDATCEVVGFFILTLFMTFMLLWFYIGSIRLALLPLVCVDHRGDLGIRPAAACSASGLDPFAILVPFLILAVSVSHGVQYVNAWIGEIDDNHRNSFDASLETWRRLAIYGTMAIMTDVVGFATIGLIPIDIIREMSINATLGMLAIIITNKVMMPIWLTWVNIGDIEEFVAKQEARDGDLRSACGICCRTWSRPIPAVDRDPDDLRRAAGLEPVEGPGAAGRRQPGGRARAAAGLALQPGHRGRWSRTSPSAPTSSRSSPRPTPKACVKYDVMDQIDRFGWRMDNTEGVASTISLPWAARTVNAAFSEADPKFKVLPRNQLLDGAVDHPDPDLFRPAQPGLLGAWPCLCSRRTTRPRPSSASCDGSRRGIQRGECERLVLPSIPKWIRPIAPTSRPARRELGVTQGRTSQQGSRRCARRA